MHVSLLDYSVPGSIAALFAAVYRGFHTRFAAEVVFMGTGAR